MSGTGRFVWYELLTPDPEAARAFYARVVGWETEPFETGAEPYTMWMVGETAVGGVMKLPQELRDQGVPPHWMAHVAVEDVDRAAARAAELGGAIRKPPTDIPEVGRFAIVSDPQGAVLSLFQPGGGPAPAPDRSAAGFIGWHELATTDHRSAWTFYSTLFGWKHTTDFDMGKMGSYSMFRYADDPEEVSAGGMSDVARHMDFPPNWLYYVNVDDADAAVERIEGAGGRVLNGPMEVPGGSRIVQASDPQGAVFALVAPE